MFRKNFKDFFRYLVLIHMFTIFDTLLSSVQTQVSTEIMFLLLEECSIVF